MIHKEQNEINRTFVLIITTIIVTVFLGAILVMNEIGDPFDWVFLRCDIKFP